MIAVVDYGIGNIQAFLNVFSRLNVPARRASTPQEVSTADRLLLPGVGHFDHAMERLNKSGLRPTLEEMVLGLRVPVIGICVGMQMLAEASDEGALPGLGWVPGKVRAFASKHCDSGLPLPHMGWNRLKPHHQTLLLSKMLEEVPQFYFLHSYYFEADDRRDVAATANYGFDFDAVVSRGHIHGAQFHPEKSHKWGEQLLRNFSEI